jgi:glyoxylase-like metal-dependent hydrolase (beta-lactamase superfamily II)
MIFESISSGGCRSYLVGCEESCAAALIDPELSQIDRYNALAARHGLRFRYLIDTHTHADHFSATRQLADQLDAPVVMHRASPAPFVDLRLEGGDLLVVGRLRLQSLHTPGHTNDSMCLCVEDRVFTGDTLLIGATGRTDLPSGDAAALHESLFQGVLKHDAHACYRSAAYQHERRKNRCADALRCGRLRSVHVDGPTESEHRKPP